MLRILSPLLLLPLMFACHGSMSATQPTGSGPSSQETYEYGDCPKYRGDCPREGTLACALKTILTKYDACSYHQDCVAAEFNAKCSGAGGCPPFYVNREMKAAFEAAAQREIDRYCENPTCKGGGPCGIIEFQGYCSRSRCTWIRVYSGGP